MPKVKITVVHTIEQDTIVDLSTDELNEMTYEDALRCCPYDKYQPNTRDSEIMDVRVDGKEHYF